MWGVEIFVLQRGGLARTSELYAAGYWQSMVQLYAAAGLLIDAGHGWWATRYTPAAVVAARKLGGRVACLSALELFGIEGGDGRLHIVLERSGTHPHQPGVVVHWSRERLAGDRQSVTVPVARRQAVRCLRANPSS